MYIMYAQYISHQICTVHCYSSPGYGTLPSICTVHCLVIPPLGKPGTVHSHLYICTVHCLVIPPLGKPGTVHYPLYMYSTLFSYPFPGQARYGTLTSIYTQYTVQLSLPGQARYGTFTSIYVQYTVQLSLPWASQVRYINLYIYTVHCLVIPPLGKPGTVRSIHRWPTTPSSLAPPQGNSCQNLN